MSWNVPDDWGCYYFKCEYCGAQCHASEGGCGCNGGVANSERPRLEDSGYDYSGEDRLWSKELSCKIHTARRNHSKRKINKGDRYRLRTHRTICDETGSSWINKVYKVMT